MVERGEMNLHDPVQKYLPASVTLPAYQGKQITLLHLATHTSGLPRDSNGELYSFLGRCTLFVGHRPLFENLGRLCRRLRKCGLHCGEPNGGDDRPPGKTSDTINRNPQD